MNLWYVTIWRWLCTTQKEAAATEFERVTYWANQEFDTQKSNGNDGSGMRP